MIVSCLALYTVDRIAISDFIPDEESFNWKYRINCLRLFIAYVTVYEQHFFD